jgi:two-component system phosphate regulon sensor histidine kinase PhoR
MTAFADQAAVAIEHARLFQQTRTQLEALTAANRRLEELDRLRQEYLRNVSHEFRTPLTVIRGYAEYLGGAEEPDASAVRDATRIIVESCDRLIDMVETLIHVSRVEQGRAAETLNVRDLDLRQVAQGSVEILRNQLEKKRIALKFEFPSDTLGVQGDGELLQQVVRKLVDNAAKYSRAGGPVVVRGRAGDDCVLLEVEDRGIGIPPEHVPRIFEKFYMVDGGLTRRTGGSGVGLYLVREILRLHGGSVEVRSQPGEGSLFCVRLPRVFKGAAHRPAAV